MDILDQFIPAISQVIVVLTLSLSTYVVSRFLFSNAHREKNVSFLEFIGLSPSKDVLKLLDKKFFLLCFILIIYAVVTTVIQFEYIHELRTLLLSDNSPYYKILKNGFGAQAIILGLIYCFIQSGAAEEILFRGLLMPRLVNHLGFKVGNVIQSILFWLMHLAIFKLVTGRWISKLQLFAFITSFSLGLIMGHINYRRGVFSILPSWILHSVVNFTTFLTLAYLVA